MQSKPLTTMVIWASVSKRRSCWPPLHRSARRPSKSTFLHRQSISRKHPSSECKKSARPRKYWEFQRSNNWGTKWGITGSEIKCNILNNKDLHIIPGGESGIRTRVRVSPKHAFQACAFSHSAISPRSIAPDCNEIRGWRPEGRLFRIRHRCAPKYGNAISETEHERPGRGCPASLTGSGWGRLPRWNLRIRLSRARPCGPPDPAAGRPGFRPCGCKADRAR